VPKGCGAAEAAGVVESTHCVALMGPGCFEQPSGGLLRRSGLWGTCSNAAGVHKSCFDGVSDQVEGF
jgi:hypothetical protein